MTSIIKIIECIRGNKNYTIEQSGSGEYALILKENNGSKTAYYFSAPIYNRHSKKLVDFKFHNAKDSIYYEGSNATVNFSDIVTISNDECTIEMMFDGLLRRISDFEVEYSTFSAFPTTNGIAIMAKVTKNSGFAFRLRIINSKFTERANDRYFSFMKEKFKPLASVSCIGATDASGNVISPAELSKKLLSANEYSFSINPSDGFGDYVFFEINLYEPKLIQDTTVESKHPNLNNAFGGAAFIGKTASLGEQWLYTKIEYSKLSSIADKRINKIVLHCPKYSKTSIPITLHKVASRFCSFGSNWQNKIRQAEFVCLSLSSELYYSADITKMSVNEKTRKLETNNGVILRAHANSEDFSVISTADNYYHPQILEINYR